MKYPEKNWLEWSVFAGSLILVMSLVGVLVYETWQASSAPAKLQVDVGSAERSSGQFALPVYVHNRGGQAAEAVQIEVQLSRNGKETERAEFEIQLIPPGAMREGRVIFESDPETADSVDARPLGYQLP